jgi:hypothetical protein
MSQLGLGLQMAFKGAETGNTAPSKTFKGVPVAGDDYLSMGCGVVWGAGFDAFLERWQLLRVDAESAGEPVQTNVDGHPYCVYPGGKKGGVGYYQIKIEWRRAMIFIRADGGPDGDTDNVRIEWSGLPLMLAGGIEAAYMDFLAFLDAFGGTCVWTKPSRYDMACDLPFVTMQPFVEALGSGRIVCRARKFSVYGTFPCIETINIGRGPVQARIYDKTKETEDDPVRQQLLCEARWGGVVPSSAVRVEFQLRRESLKSFGIESFEDLVELRGGLARNMTELWFRVTSEVPDKNHAQRAKISPVWDMVRCGFERAFGTADVVQRRQSVKPVVREQFARQILGLAARYFAEANPGEVVDSLTAMLARVISDFWPLLGPEDFQKAMDRARVRAYRVGFDEYEGGAVTPFLSRETGHLAERPRKDKGGTDAYEVGL